MVEIRVGDSVVGPLGARMLHQDQMVEVWGYRRGLPSWTYSKWLQDGDRALLRKLFAVIGWSNKEFFVCIGRQRIARIEGTTLHFA